jgi:eukaryotic-like serine/threonine-protein kinase
MKTFYWSSLAVILSTICGHVVGGTQKQPLPGVRLNDVNGIDSIYSVRSKNFHGIKWKFKTDGKIFSSPTVLDGVAYIGSEDHYLYAVDAGDGTLKWKFKTGGPVHTSPAVYKATVYVGSFDGYYYAVDINTGLEKWKVKTNGERWMGGKGYFGMKPLDEYLDDPWDYFLSSPSIDASDSPPTLYFGSSDGNLYAVDAANGKVKWKFLTEGSIHTTPAIYNHTVYVGSWDTNLYAVDARTGKLKWKFKTGDQPGMSGIQASPRIDDGKIYFGARDAHMYALDAMTGKVIWKYDAEKSWILTSAAVQEGTVYVGTSDSFLLLALDAKTGNEKSRFQADGYVYSSPVVKDNSIFFGDFTGKIFCVDVTSSGKKWSEFVTDGRKENGASVLNNKGKLDFAFAGSGQDLSIYKNVVGVMNRFYTLGPIVSTPSVEDGVVYVGSADGFLYAINLAD